MTEYVQTDWLNRPTDWRSN